MSDRNRVLWLTPDKPDNISVGRRRIADHLEDRGFQVTIRGTTIRTVLRSIREADKYDAIIGTTRAGAFAGVLLKLVHHEPLIVDHVDPIRQFEETHPQWLAAVVRILENASFWIADHVLYVYEEELERIARFATDMSQTDLGVEYGHFSDPDLDAEGQATDPSELLRQHDRVAIYVGGLEPIYHIRSLLEATSELDGWCLLIFGNGTLSDYVQSIAETQANVLYPGTIPHEVIPHYLHEADVGISLVDDPHTLKVLEYGAAGLPVIQISGSAEDRFGSYVEYCDANPKSIASAIKRANARTSTDDFRSFVSNFDWADIAEDYNQVLRKII